MILELAGIPGSGKTTVRNPLEKQLRERGYKCLERKDIERFLISSEAPLSLLQKMPDSIPARAWLYGRLSLKLSGDMLRSMRAGYLVQRMPRTGAYWLLKDSELHTYFTQNFDLLEASNLVYLLEEGFVQHAAADLVWRHATAYVERLIEKLPELTMTVAMLHLPVEVAVERVLERGIPDSWPSRFHSRRGVKKICFDFAEAIDYVTELLAEKGIRIISLESEAPPEDTTNEILSTFPARN